MILFYFIFRKNVPLKKVNSKYILKSTLTPHLARKQFQKNTTNLERSRSWSSLDRGQFKENDYSSQNYLTVHVSFIIKIFTSHQLIFNQQTCFKIEK